MSKMVMVCFKEKPRIDQIIYKLNKMNERLIPDNIKESKPNILSPNPKLLMAVYSQNSTVLQSPDNAAICLGTVFGNSNWEKPGLQAPDGTYALIRSNDKYVEAVSDMIGSRTIWYYMDQDKFIVSTSQRAIIMLVGSFELNEKVIPWMLSAGNLGPSLSWDKRIQCLPPNSIASLNRNEWRLNVSTSTAVFDATEQTTQEHTIRLEKAIQETFNDINIKPDQWVIPLSGGYDSRALLLFLKEKYNLETITWGTESSLSMKHSDSQIAKELSEYLGIKNSFFLLDKKDISAKTILNRFIQNGEGRIDHLSGYVDGFDLWKMLHERGIKGIIRGDVPWPTSYPMDEKDLRRILGLSLWTDYINLPHPTQFDIPDQDFPEEFSKKENESLGGLRNRLYQNVRMPLILAALNDLKTPYIELTNPFLSRKIIEVTRSLPENLLKDKQLFKEIINKHSPAIGYAKYSANEENGDILQKESMKELLIEEITHNGDSVFSDTYLTFILNKLRNQDNTVRVNYIKRIKSLISPYISKRFKAQIRNHVTKQNMDFNVLAFRSVIIIKMKQLLQEDMKFLR
ncbi:hypothetical protein ACFFJI_09975 [Allobacillus sp. GCM10007491]|uniref:asparagine synthase (glutamine-hydrolyzing) n=1 Tax=Allobacillus saliphilus TaxID=2912308 RepID=A0A941HRG0_9BACI|nr:hypothetical protein [Allobacillus saliphilus]MBR7552551.1 hypothetical protein [Allobacillus saliphilus]